MQDISGTVVLRGLRISLHVMFAFLLIFGCISSWLAEPDARIALVLGTLLLGASYLAGTVAENRASRSTDPFQQKQLRSLAPLWLAVITLLWIFLMLLSPAFTWVVFPLVFLYLHLLSVPWALMATAVLTAFAILYPMLSPNGFAEFNPGVVIGPTMGSALAVVVSFAYRALYNDSLRHQATADRLRAAQVELSQKEHEAGRLEERERIAREIHDTIAQGLSSIVLVSRAAAADLPAGSPAASRIATIEEVASSNLAEARRFIKDLSSPALDSALVPALARLAETTQQQAQARGSDLTCTFVVEGSMSESEAALPAEHSATILRTAQGALANVSAHARAHRAVLTLSFFEETTSLDIFDDGVGFDPLLQRQGLTQQNTGYGLTSLTERAGQVGGSLNVDSAPGRGSLISLTIPTLAAQNLAGSQPVGQ